MANEEKQAKKEAKSREKAEAKVRRELDTKNLKVLWQYVIGTIVVLGGFICGTCIGWSSPASALLADEGISESEFAWVSSIFALGGAFAQIFGGLSIKLMGFKYSIIIFEIITGLSWVPLTFSTNFYILLLGRLIAGFSAGFCVICPTYLGEMAHKCHRGTLGVFFQLFITGGILYTFVLGVTKNLALINIACAAWCGIGVILTLLFVPESPYVLMKKDKEEKAMKVMVRIRGAQYDNQKELNEIKSSLGKKESAKEGLKNKVNLKASGVLLMLHIIQQLSGINAVLYHAQFIFSTTATDISPDVSVIIIGIAQVLITLVAAAAVDRAGRILLFVISLGIMFVTIGLVGFFFTMQRINQSAAESMALVPTLALVLYICGFSLGTGPLPWAMLGEYLTDSVKPVMSTAIAFTNWICAFGISWMMPVVMTSFDPEWVFYAFAIVCLLGAFAVLMFVVETNQKSFDEIQADIAAHKIGLMKKK